MMRFSGHSLMQRRLPRIILEPMCGRSTLHDAPTNILERFSLPPVLPGFEPHYNIAPTQQQWTIARTGNRSPVARRMRWGLIPSWADDPSIGNRLINARAESLTERPAFSTPLRTQRCLILADGYYEWRRNGKTKTPVYFRLSDGRAFAFAGLWDCWNKGEAPLETCTVITTSAGKRAAVVHDRMPAMLVDDAVTSWLDVSARPRQLLSLLAPYDAEDLEMYEVARDVNNPANDSPECIARIQADSLGSDHEEHEENGELFLGKELAPVRPRSPR